MDVSLFSQGVGWLACVGSLGLIALVVLVGRIIAGQREKPMEPNNPAVRPPNTPPFEDSDFGGVPATGAAREHARDVPREQIIGSSGFEDQQHADDPTDDPPRRPWEEDEE
jgi:hypothetical protein